jgi:hypothetical protein
LKTALWTVATLVGAFIIFCVWNSQQSDEIEREACQHRITLMSKNPSTVKIGYGNYEPQFDKNESGQLKRAATDKFYWGRTELQMQNGFGAMLGVNAICTVDAKTHEVLDVKLD